MTKLVKTHKPQKQAAWHMLMQDLLSRNLACPAQVSSETAGTHVNYVIFSMLLCTRQGTCKIRERKSQILLSGEWRWRAIQATRRPRCADEQKNKAIHRSKASCRRDSRISWTQSLHAMSGATLAREIESREAQPLAGALIPLRVKACCTLRVRTSSVSAALFCKKSLVTVQTDICGVRSTRVGTQSPTAI